MRSPSDLSRKQWNVGLHQPGRKQHSTLWYIVPASAANPGVHDRGLALRESAESTSASADSAERATRPHGYRKRPLSGYIGAFCEHPAVLNSSLIVLSELGLLAREDGRLQKAKTTPSSKDERASVACSAHPPSPSLALPPAAQARA